MIQITKVWWDGNKLMAEPIDPATVYKDNEVAQPDSTCSETLRVQGKAYPRTCRKCGKGPCIALVNAALDKKAENARELGLDYEPDYKVTVVDDQHPNGVPLEQWGRPAPDLQAELEATNRQVEILSDALAESRREVAAQSAPVPMAHIVGEIDHTGKVWKPVQPAPVQEPVAWIADTKRGYNTVGYECKKVNALPHGTMLYTTPLAANRQWVGLTDEERDDFALLCGSYATVCAIEDTIKEKNI
jgi:hypothetical protein